jgi:diamine N-acetyltransferase
MIALSNGNVTLRALEPEDVELLYYWENHPEVWRISSTYAPISKYLLANYIQNSGKDIWENRSLRLVIADSSRLAVGTVELFDFEPYHMRAGVGIIVFSEYNRRKGLAGQALELLFQYALETVGIAQLYANVLANNTASLALFSKLGFETIGVKKRWVKTVDGWSDEVMLQKFLK